MGIFDRLFGKKSDEANDNKEQQLPKGVKCEVEAIAEI